MRTDPKVIFVHASRFNWASNLLHNARRIAPSERMVAAYPASVMDAFTIELYLKSLIVLQGGIAPSTHDLDELYGRLPRTIRTEIERAWDTMVCEPSEIARLAAAEDELGIAIPRDLPGSLRACRNALVLLRYDFEPGLEGARFYLGELPALLLIKILELKPEWSDAIGPVTADVADAFAAEAFTRRLRAIALIATGMVLVTLAYVAVRGW